MHTRERVIEMAVHLFKANQAASRACRNVLLTLVLTLPAYTESSLDKQGVRHSSPLTIKD